MNKFRMIAAALIAAVSPAATVRPTPARRDEPQMVEAAQHEEDGELREDPEFERQPFLYDGAMIFDEHGYRTVTEFGKDYIEGMITYGGQPFRVWRERGAKALCTKEGEVGNDPRLWAEGKKPADFDRKYGGRSEVLKPGTDKPLDAQGQERMKPENIERERRAIEIARILDAKS